MSKGHTKVKFGLHKLLFIMTFALICLNICGMKCNAEEKNTIDEVDAKIEKILKDFENAIPEEYGEIADINDAAEAVSVKRIFEGIIDAIRGKSGELTALLLLLLGIALISTLASLINSELGTVSSRAVGVVASAILFERLVVLVVGAVRSLDEVSGFFEAVIPISLAVNSLGASPTTASTKTRTTATKSRRIPRSARARLATGLPCSARPCRRPSRIPRPKRATMRRFCCMA